VKSPVSRRQFFSTLGFSFAAAPLLSLDRNLFPEVPARPARKIHIFSKHLQWLDYEPMAAFVSECGFDGADITVRIGGHVEPHRVKDDLPRAVEAMKKAGKQVEMITTSILSADEPNTEAIIRTAGSLGIQLYRMGWYPYDTAKSISENLRTIEESFRALIALNEKYKIRGSYQNHSGNSFGSPVWDLARLLHALDSPWIGCQYDIRHATVEGANSWTLGFEYVKPYINSVDVKDFRWKTENGKWVPENVPLGQGAIDFDEYARRMRSVPASIPICLHMEYPLGGAENGSREITMSRDEIKSAMVRDLKFIRERM
jgi:sugar phosphate isomerase/epimerase